MVYTYDDFTNEAQNAGLLSQFSSADLNLAKTNPDAGMSLLSYKKEYATATTDDQRALANAGAEKLRKNLGNYTAGSTGTGFTVNTNNSTPYSSQADSLIEKLGSDSFSYDAETDPAAQSYKKMYTREGERATKNALGEAAANTGGIASTAAVTAASQAGQYYASQLADKTTELEENAYNRYMQEKNIDLAILDALEGLDSTEYTKKTTQEAADTSALENEAALLATSGDYSLYKQLYPQLTDAQIKAIAAANTKTTGTTYSGTLTGGDGGNDGYSGGDEGDGNNVNDGGDKTLAEVSDEVNQWLAEGDTVETLSADLEANKSGMSAAEYKKYRLVLDSISYDAGKNARK